jgi:hypothetical protein
MFVVCLLTTMRRDTVATNVDSRLHGGDLALSLRALLKLRHLLSLNGRSGDLLTEDDVANLAGGERRNVDAVALAEVLSPYPSVKVSRMEAQERSHTARMRSFIATSTLIHSSSESDGHTK